MADLVWDGAEPAAARLPARRESAPRLRPVTALGPLTAAGLALLVLARIAAPDVTHPNAAAAPPPVSLPAAPVALPAPVLLSATGPYVGPDVAKAQQDFKNPNRTDEQDMNAGLLDPTKMLADGMDFEFAKASQGT